MFKKLIVALFAVALLMLPVPALTAGFGSCAGVQTLETENCGGDQDLSTFEAWGCMGEIDEEQLCKAACTGEHPPNYHEDVEVTDFDYDEETGLGGGGCVCHGYCNVPD